MRIDAHQHFWEYQPKEYPWIKGKLESLGRNFLPPDLVPDLTQCQLDGSIAVQARQCLEESTWLLNLARQNPRILGVVGWVELCSERVEEQLTLFAADPLFVGVRHVVQDEPDDAFMLRSDFQNGISKLKAFDLSYDILIFPRQMEAALNLIRRFPEQPFIIDHLAKPKIRDGLLREWKVLLGEMAQYPNVYCKVSGMVTEADWKYWQPQELKPYLDAVFETFAPDKLMFGSDWPVCLLASNYSIVHGLVDSYAKHLSSGHRKALFGGTASHVYQIAPRS
ncbi:MAG: amidohydrolase family protein [Verrucomicrobiota bacterium]|jgi:L-fuconolactonase|nr:amidohydrolase family protein [Verrucomicrobiota bacterium]MDG1891861.1 amidohydrolase family protein [Verrucomicrobiota bacterium]